MITVSTQPVYNLQAEVKETLLDYYATMGMTEALRRCLKSGIDQTKVIILPYYPTSVPWVLNLTSLRRSVWMGAYLVMKPSLNKWG